ncbi:MAG: DUF2283 domain-containing protein [Phycisphaerae bacterium]|nr:DUF2283 domain-containing protein [Phycisphaerae bacterium]
MDAIKILDKKEDLNWDYDEEADVLYISTGQPVPAVGLDVGDGVIVRYRQDTREFVGLTVIGVRQRCLTALSKEG